MISWLQIWPTCSKQKWLWAQVTLYMFTAGLQIKCCNSVDIISCNLQRPFIKEFRAPTFVNESENIYEAKTC